MNQGTSQKPDISVAPMMDWTDRHCRYFLRLISPNTRLYTEMITTGAIIHGDHARFLHFDPSEQPLALQLGGSNPEDLAKSSQTGEKFGYNEINLNCGCPSDRVQEGSFGACLMKEPNHVALCIQAMQETIDVPVTVKCRIGIDDLDDFAFLDRFVGTIADKGCKTFVIHARKAWLKGLSPKENREIPPLAYERVQEVKNKYPQLRIIVNGGIESVEQIIQHLQIFDGVMIGRAAYYNPWLLAEIEEKIFKNNKIASREEVARHMIPYIDRQAREFDTPVKSITRHMINLYQGLPGARAWRRSLSTLPHMPEAGPDVIEQALAGRNVG